MCTGLEIIALAGMAASAAGGLMSYNDAQKNANAQARAANEQLFAMLDKNRKLSDEARLQFGSQVENFAPEQTMQNLEGAQSTRTSNLSNAIATDTSPSPFLGDVPEIVKQAFESQQNQAVSNALGNAARMGTLGGYTDFMHANQLSMADAARNVGVLGGFAQSNAAMLPAMQQYAMAEATKPSSGLGEILAAAGNAASTYAGAKAGMPFGAQKAAAAGPTNIIPPGYFGA